METNNKNSDFIRQIISNDLSSKKLNSKIITRFPPEPNGHLHIGHAKSMCLNFGIAKEFEGKCHLRFDDTNPTKEKTEYIESIKKDIRWLGWDWGNSLYYASDHFEKLHAFAIDLIKKEKAYVDDLNQEKIREYRGTLTEPGKESPYRNRTIEENLTLFEKMNNGEFPDGSKVLRAKIDMNSGNLNMRDPVLYRILHESHHRTSNKWCIYPMYDWAHGQSDSIEGITHSLCTMEFEDHRPLYDWLIESLEINHPQQIEFARLNITHTVLSKRKLGELVEKNHVSGWDDPRMPTLSGIRRRGYTPAAIKNFCNKIGIAKRSNTVELGLLEHCVREDLNIKAKRIMAVLNPVKIIIDNYPNNKTEELEAVNHPNNPDLGTRKILFSKELYIEKEDFMENPSKKFFRLAPGQEVRLRYGYFITCTNITKNKTTGEIEEIHCTYDPKTKGGQSPDGRKVKGTIHWLEATSAINIEVRLYSHLFDVDKPDELDNYLESINKNSLEINKNAMIEKSILTTKSEDPYQFERVGYFYIDPIDSHNNNLVFNRTVSLRDSWNK